MGIDLPYVTKGLKVVKVTDTRIIFMHAKGSSRTKFHDEIVVLMVTKRKRGGKFSTMTFKFRKGLFRCKVFLYRAYILEQSSLDEMKGIR